MSQRRKDAVVNGIRQQELSDKQMKSKAIWSTAARVQGSKRKRAE